MQQSELFNAFQSDPQVKVPPEDPQPSQRPLEPIPALVLPAMPIRTLKIEEDGDRWLGTIKPKIRLRGHWLARMGFTPGSRVNVKCIAHGILELRAGNAELILNESANPKP